jgi:DNA-directed RNA polymerase alpha subunit
MLDERIEDVLELTDRTINKLKYAKILTINDLLQSDKFSQSSIQQYNIGDRTRTELFYALLYYITDNDLFQTNTMEMSVWKCKADRYDAIIKFINQSGYS